MLDAQHRRQIVGAFRDKRATNGREARRLPELGLNDSRILREMVRSAILRRAGPDRYYLDEDIWAMQRNMAGGRFLSVALMLGLALIVTFLLLT